VAEWRKGGQGGLGSPNGAGDLDGIKRSEKDHQPDASDAGNFIWLCKQSRNPEWLAAFCDGQQTGDTLGVRCRVDKDEREEFLRRENELSDQLAEMVSRELAHIPVLTGLHRSQRFRRKKRLWQT